jgi:predicted nucleotide-binding protein
MLEQLKSDLPEVRNLLLRQELVEHEASRADFLISVGELISFQPGSQLITVGEYTTDVYFLLVGNVKVHIGKHVLKDIFPSGNHVGEMAAIHAAARSASVSAVTTVIALKVVREEFRRYLDAFPHVYKTLALDFARRIEVRNTAIGKPGRRHRIFAISSAEALPVALTGVREFSHESAYEFVPWPAEVFRTSSYPMDDLEAELDRADFAIAIAQADDMSTSREVRAVTPRDNVIFELGLFMGRLGRKRTVLMVPKGTDVKLPSDLIGMSVVKYSPDIATSPTDAMAAWLEVKDCFKSLI